MSDVRLIDANALIEDLEYDIRLDEDRLMYAGTELAERELVQFDKDCKQNAIDLLLHAPTIEPKQEWIPCEERLPEVGMSVLVTSKNGYVYTSNIAHGEWEYGGEIVAWMPLPEPYKETADES